MSMRPALYESRKNMTKLIPELGITSRGFQ